MAGRRSRALGLALALAAACCALLAAGPGRARAAAQPARRHLTIALAPRHPAALAAFARAVSTPGSPHYGDYLTPRRFRARFGASPARIALVRAALRSRGLRPGHASAGGLSIAATGDAQATAALRARGGADAAAALPGAVQSVIGLRPAAAHPLALRARHPRALPAPQVARGPGGRARPHAAGPQACTAAADAAPTQGAYTTDQIASAYDFEPLYASGDEGAGVTVAVYELEPNDPGDVAAFQHCYGTHASISYVKVDGGVGEGAGSDEAAFDIENLVGFAPRARVLVYQAPNSSSGLPGSGPYDLFSAIINQDRAQVVSVSWGQCEAQLGRRAATAEHALFEQAVAQGQTIVAAAGDDGAEDCASGDHDTSLSPAVDDPASQPDVTGVGGTTLSAPTDPPVESVWNSGGAGTSGLAPGAGGGGVSSLWPMGPDQRDAPARLHVAHAAAAGPACGQLGGACREVPDVAADADPATGYAIFWNGADTEPEPSGWQGLGGTSGAAPVWAALFALADAAPACRGTPLGFAGPALYRAAAAHYAADFHDVTAGNNDFTGTDGGRWPASRGYDLTTGLGTPDAAHLVAGLCANALRLAPLAGQSSAVRAGVSVSLHGRDIRGATLRYTAEHLPPGVSVQADTGRMVGTPSAPGRYRVLAGVRDGQDAVATHAFTWVVGGSPHAGAARLSAGALSLTVRSGPHVPSLRTLRIAVPRGLRVRSVTQVTVRARGRAVVRVRHRVMTISLSSPAPSATLSIPVLRDGGALPTHVRILARTGTTGTSQLLAPLTEDAR
jgi:Pro-kumamolisin, activation domain/Putative Ig domain